MFKKSIAIICLFTLFTACDKLDDLTKFDMGYSQRATIPSSAGIDLPFDVLLQKWRPIQNLLLK